MAVIKLKRPSSPLKKRGEPMGRTGLTGDLRIVLALGRRMTASVPAKVDLNHSGELRWTTTSVNLCSKSFMHSLTEKTLSLFEARAA